jgi:hypothetical protein
MTANLTDEKHRRFLLQSLRAASLEAKLWAEELIHIGQSLKDDVIDTDEAVRWVMDRNLLWLVKMVPEELARIAKAQETPEVTGETA